MALAIAGTLLHHGIVDYKLILIALVLGTIIGVPLGKVQMTAVPQRTALSHSFGALWRDPRRNCRILSTARRADDAFHDGRPLYGSNSRCAHDHRQLDGRGETSRMAAAAPDHLQGQNFANLGLLGVAIIAAIVLVIHPSARNCFPPSSRFHFSSA